MEPSVAVGGCTPSPRKESADSSRIRLEKLRLAITTTGEIRFGIMCTVAMRQGPAPAARAASTKGISRRLRTCARISLAKCAQ